MSCEDNKIEIKTGSNADFSMLVTDNDPDDPQPISIAGWVIDMDFIEAKTGTILSDCSTTNGSIVINEYVDDTGQDPIYYNKGEYTVSGGSTTGWQLGEMPVDIKYTYAGKSQHTDDFTIDIIKGRSQ